MMIKDQIQDQHKYLKDKQMNGSKKQNWQQVMEQQMIGLEEVFLFQEIIQLWELIRMVIKKHFQDQHKYLKDKQMNGSKSQNWKQVMVHKVIGLDLVYLFQEIMQLLELIKLIIKDCNPDLHKYLKGKWMDGSKKQN